MWINKDKLRDMIDDGIEEYFVLNDRVEQMIKSAIKDELNRFDIPEKLSEIRARMNDDREENSREHSHINDRAWNMVGTKLSNIIETEEWIDALIERIKRKQIK